MVTITTGEIESIIKYIYKISGISLDHSKTYLIEGRLGTLLDEYGFSSFAELIQKASLDPTKSLEKEIINRITTQETLFFRDNAPFELLKHKILPDLIDKRTPSFPVLPVPLKIWSAACSTGQEIYSIAITLNELLPDLNRYNIKLLGTDISDTAIAKASYGEYNRFEVMRGLSQERLQKYFINTGDTWKIKDEIRYMVQFKKMNLMEPYTSRETFDIIFCRNVAIYFSKDDRTFFYENLAKMLSSDGYLIVGASESMVGVCQKFEPYEYLRTLFYQFKE